MECNHVRDELACNPTSSDPEVQRHVQNCTSCAAYCRRHTTLDQMVRAELHWEMPVDLSARLLSMALAPVSVGMPQPKRWHVVLAYVLVVFSVLLSVLVAWYGLAQLSTQFDIQAQLAALMAWPAQALAQLTQALPESRYLVDFFLRVRTQLVWLLLVALVWATLDRWNPQFTFRRQSA